MTTKEMRQEARYYGAHGSLRTITRRGQTLRFGYYTEDDLNKIAIGGRMSFAVFEFGHLRHLFHMPKEIYLGIRTNHRHHSNGRNDNTGLELTEQKLQELVLAGVVTRLV